jgi:hypothetical protein
VAAPPMSKQGSTIPSLNNTGIFCLMTKSN